jgi:hypothetical protein
MDRMIGNRNGMPIRAAWVICMFLLSMIADTPAQLAKANDFPEPLPGYAATSRLREDASLQAVAFADETNGVAVGDRGTILLTKDAGATWQIKASGVECRLDDVIWINPNRLVAVGGAYDRVTHISRGVVLTSQDAGQSWRRANDQELPRLRTVSVRDTRNTNVRSTIVATGDWSASSLSREFESSDSGSTWHNGGELDGPVSQTAAPTAAELLRWTKATKVNTPIRDACRVGAAGLCAVGDHGIITQSDDGGKTWRTTRGDSRQCASLIFANSAATVPWPIIGIESLEMRNRISVIVHDRASKSSDPTAAAPNELACQAAVALGASGVDELATDRSQASWQQCIESWLAIHQPRVIIIDQSLPSELREALKANAVAAGTDRIVGYTSGGGGESMRHSDALLPATGVLNRDLWQDALQLVAPKQIMPTAISIRRLYDANGSGKRGESLLAGIQVTEGEKLSAPASVAPRRQLQVVQGRLTQPARIANLLRSSSTADDFASGLSTILDQSAKEDQFRLAWSTLLQVESYPTLPLGYSHGVLNIIAERFSDHSAGKWAALRSDAIAHSLEWRKLRNALSDSISPANQAFQNSPLASQAAGGSMVAQASEIVAVSPFQTGDNRVVQASAATPLLVPKPQQVTWQAKPKKSSQIDLNWEFHPLRLLSQEAAHHRSDQDQLQPANEDSGNLKRLRDDRRADVWTRLAGNMGNNRATRNVRTRVLARPADAPPNLDGILNDPIWKSPALALAGVRSLPQVAYDEEYLYVAWQCPSADIRADDFDRSRSSKVRDHDLTNLDRIEISLDLDHDLMTSMRFATTDAGRTFDAVDQHSQFDPTWYIDVAREGANVNFELAIQRRDILDLPIVPGQSCLIKARCIRANETESSVMPNPDDWLRVEFQ